MQYFWGPDTYAAREAIDSVAMAARAHVRWVDQAQVQEEGIAGMVGRSRGLFGTDIVVVRDPSSFSKVLQETITTYVAEEGAERSWILWDREMPDKRSRLWKAVKPYAQEFLRLSPPELGQWLRHYAEHHGGVLETGVAEMLVARIGVDRWRLANEVQRLVLVAAGGAVTPRIVEEEVAVAESAEIFAMLDALIRGEEASALRSIEVLLEAGHSEFYILSMLAYQFRTLLVIRAGIDEGQTPTAIAQRGKLHPYVVEKNMPVARRVFKATWQDSLTRILATDFAIKQGTVDPRTGLLMVVVTLAQSLKMSAVTHSFS